MKKIQFRVTGGLGKNIMASAVVRQFKIDHPDSKIHVIASYPDVFINNPNIDRVYPYTGANATMVDFRDVNKDFDIYEYEPYSDLQYRLGNEHLVDTWCRRMNLGSPSKLSGEIFLTDEEKMWASEQKKRLNINVPIMAVQISGGTSSYSPNEAANILRPKQVRDLPIEIAQKVVDEISKLGIFILQIGLPTEKRLERVAFLDAGNSQVLPIRLTLATINECDMFFGIDSFIQHAWAAFDKQNAIVVWGATNPKNLGYSANNNISMSKQCPEPHCNRPDGIMFDILGNGGAWQCPYKGKCMNFDPKELVSAITAVIPQKKG